ncbi:DnaJ family domain-containing protein [Kineococcus sp. SYSU DK002]|uniref:DnaJ family domain-containing protein n=1 Tax=Kineococcus sp. SYSU DK002 TaxID=3383123 RepID=UPI003D7E9BE9
MSGREPVRRSFEDRVERLVREARERGDFDDLPGAGAPLRGLDREFSAEQWAADKARREGFDVAGMLPPALALRREREALARDVHELTSETVVREVVEGFNDRVRELYRRPAEGPFVAVALLDADALVGEWVQRRRAAAAARAPAPDPAPPARGWFARWRRRGHAR